jgi:GT2 family glycosyltransferase
MRVAALVIDFKSLEEAQNLTVQLTQSQKKNFELTVFHVDNGNSEAVPLSAKQSVAGVRLIRNIENTGYGGGVRKAIEQIRKTDRDFDAYWILNSDLEIESDTLTKLVEKLMSHPRIGAIGPRVMKGRTGEIWGERGVVSPTFGLTAMVKWPAGGVLPKWSYIPGSSMLVRTQAYDDVGGIPDRYRLYYEETELCVRMQKAGWDLWVEPSAVVYHSVNSLRHNVPARHYAFYFARNNLYFWKSNFGIPAGLQLPRTLYTVTKELVLPLRRSETPEIFLDRLKFVAMGLMDGFFFLKQRYTPFEKRHFEVEKHDKE